MKNHNTSILKILPETTIRFRWAGGKKIPSDLKSKMFLTPSQMINSSFYRCGPIDYLTQDPYDHVFLEVTKVGEKYYPPPSNSGVVSLNNCSVCLIPETCLLFMVNAKRVKPPRACKKAVVRRVKQQLDSVGEDTIGQQTKDISKSEIKEGENINACEGNMPLHPLHGCSDCAHYMDKPNF